MNKNKGISEMSFKSTVPTYRITKTVTFKARKFVQSEVELESDRNYWNNTLKFDKHADNINLLISELIERNYSPKNSKRQLRYEGFLKKTREAYTNYLSESEENDNNKFPAPSVESFYQLARFIPEFPDQHIDVYLDSSSGFFGVMIHTINNGTPLLNLLMQDNREVIFSYIKRKNKIIKISGRAYFNDDLDDSSEITKLFRLISE